MPSPKILITGGSGLLGKHLREFFAEKNLAVKNLTRNPNPAAGNFHWDVEANSIDPNTFHETDTIIHLAGAGLAVGRWTTRRKKEIIDSRVKSAELIFEKLKTASHGIRTFISASAIGIYGDCGDVEVDETSAHENDFSAEVCKKWELAANQFSAIGIRVVILRIGIVLAKDGGALPQLALPVKLFVGSPLGSGKQYMSWIHVDDLCSLFLKAVEDEKMNGVFNAVAPNPVTNTVMMKSLAKILHRPILPLHVPAVVLKMILGEKAGIVLGGQKVSSKKIQEMGFKFQFENIENAMENIFRVEKAH